MYHQLLETITGIKFTSYYANLFMSGIESKTFQDSDVIVLMVKLFRVAFRKLKGLK